MAAEDGGQPKPRGSQLTAQVPAIEPTIALDIIAGRTPRELLNMKPLIPPAAILLNESCFPRKCPIVLLMPLYIIAITPAELPMKGPRRVMALRAELSRSLGGADAGTLCNPSAKPHAPPIDSAVKYVTPVP